ncbi:MAG TPA: trimethylamine methyltransferase family protein [Thermoleophilia bacterium]|nr:trimethylamine methyltransferase family protein [Thermoleophilia bacterium]
MIATLQLLTTDERAEVHERSLKVLATVGMRVDSDAGRDILKDAGARVSESTRIARFPPELVEESLALAPKHFSLGGRDPDFEFPLNVGRATLLNGGGDIDVVDRETGETRPGTYDDWVEITRLVDALPEIGVAWVETGEWTAERTPAAAVSDTAETARLFSRHLNTSFDDPAVVPWWLETLTIVHGSRDEVVRRHPISFLFTPVSPLVAEGAVIDTWLAMRDWQIPTMVMPMPLMGATAPGSRLATILQTNCEILGMLCLIEAAAPGTPFVYAPIIASVDPRSGRYAGGAALTALSCAGTEMARHYDLPVCSHAFSCDAWVPGTQAAYEKAFGMLLAGLSWPDVLVGPGVLAGGLSFGLEQLVIDVEIWRMCRAAHDGVATGPDRWLDDVLERVGPGGSFLGERSTRRGMHGDEWFVPRLGTQGARAAWEEAGRPDVVEEARQKVADILATHRAAPWNEDVERALAQLRQRALDA